MPGARWVGISLKRLAAAASSTMRGVELRIVRTLVFAMALSLEDIKVTRQESIGPHASNAGQAVFNSAWQESRNIACRLARPEFRSTSPKLRFRMRPAELLHYFQWEALNVNTRPGNLDLHIDLVLPDILCCWSAAHDPRFRINRQP